MEVCEAVSDSGLDEEELHRRHTEDGRGSDLASSAMSVDSAGDALPAVAGGAQQTMKDAGGGRGGGRGWWAWWWRGSGRGGGHGGGRGRGEQEAQAAAETPVPQQQQSGGDGTAVSKKRSRARDSAT